MNIHVTFRNGRTWTGRAEALGTRFGDGGTYLQLAGKELRIRTCDILTINTTPETTGPLKREAPAL